MIDIHTHALPAVDDGSPSIAVSLDMLHTAQINGTTDIILTPHIIEKHNALSWSSIVEHTHVLQRAADEHNILIKLHPGAELEMNWELLDLLSHDAYCLAGSKYILVELPASMIPTYADDFWFELRIAGLVPILAHPERHMPLMQQPIILERWRREGLLMQSNAGSLAGLYGSTVQKHMQTLIVKDYVDFIASDAHNNTRRNPNLTEISILLTEQFGLEYANKLLKTSPQTILTTINN